MLLDVLRDVIEHPPTPKLVAAPLPLALGRPGLAREPCCVHVDLRHFLQVSVRHVGEQQLRLVDSFQERLALRELVAAELEGDPVAHAQLVQSDHRGIQAGTVGTHFESLTIRPARPPFEIQVLGESLPIYAVTGRPCRWLHTRACCLGRLLGSLPRWGAPPLQILRGLSFCCLAPLAGLLLLIAVIRDDAPDFQLQQRRVPTVAAHCSCGSKGQSPARALGAGLLGVFRMG